MTDPRPNHDGVDFRSLGLAPALLSVLTDLGYEEPTPVQREAIPLLLAGRDVLAQAATGTGKTAAFALPLLQRLMAGSAPGSGKTRALILVPTRELAMQVAEAVHKYGKGIGAAVVPVYGGASMDQQIRALRRGAAVVVATPGRALDHLKRGTLDVTTLETLVLDEADEMLDMGFAEDLETILETTPETRQTALFAATMPARIAAIAGRHLKDPARVTIAREKPVGGKMPRVRQTVYVVARQHKPAALGRLLDIESPTSALVFCRTRLEVEEVAETLNAHGYRADALHGGIAQRQRDKVMTSLRAGKTDLVVATDVAARGLDIDHLSHVINYDVPSSPETVRAPDRQDGPHRAKRRRDHARRAARAPAAAQHRAAHQAEDRDGDAAHRRRSPRAPARAHARGTPRAAAGGRPRRRARGGGDAGPGIRHGGRGGGRRETAPRGKPRARRPRDPVPARGPLQAAPEGRALRPAARSPRRGRATAHRAAGGLAENHRRR